MKHTAFAAEERSKKAQNKEPLESASVSFSPKLKNNNIIIIIHLFTVGKVSSQYKLIKTNYLNINPIYKCCIGIVLPSNF